MTALSDQAIERLRAAANWPEFTSERYTVTDEIGRGGMGAVYAATDGELGRDVAIKVSNAVAPAVLERRLASEARVLALLEHPGIVPVHDVGRLAGGRTFYVMKRVRGQTLSEHLARDLELGERLRIFERICEAVAFAHDRGILHRDLKPGNVMIGSFGEVMVMDWGVATTMSVSDPQSHGVPSLGPQDRPMPREPMTGPGAVVGTHGFMSPEQARGESLDGRTDVYSLGAILLALVNKNEAAIGTGAPGKPAAVTAPAAVPRPLLSICRKALSELPAERYASAAALGDDVARFRAGQAVAAHRETSLERVARVARVYQVPIVLVLSYMIMRALVALATAR